MNSPGPIPRRAGLGRVVMVAWLAVLTILVASDHVTFRAALADPQRQADRAALAAAQNEVNAIGSRLEELAARESASQATATTAQQVLDQRLEQLSREFTDRVTTDDLNALRDRVHTFEKQLAASRRNAIRPKATHPGTTAATGTPQPMLPPFSIIGIELRGGQRFLSIAPLSASSIGELRVLRPGDSEAHWRLDSLGARTAQFTVDGITHQVSVP